MKKLKTFFATPLVSSSVKISPWMNDSSEIDRSDTKTKSKEIIPPPPPVKEVDIPKPEIPKPTLMRKALSAKNLETIRKKKKNSLPTIPSLHAMQKEKPSINFDFEAFEELVDTKKLGRKKPSIVIEEDEIASPVNNIRTKSYSTNLPEQSTVKRSSEFFKKSELLSNNNIQKNFAAFLPSPTIRSPLNLSRIDENIGLLNSPVESYRKDVGSDVFEAIDIGKDRKDAISPKALDTDMPLFTQEKTDNNEDTKAKDTKRSERRKSSRRNKHLSIDIDEVNKEKEEEKPNLDHTELVERLAEKLNIGEKGENKEKTVTIKENNENKGPSDGSKSESDSNDDSLVENNPFHDISAVKKNSDMVHTLSMKENLKKIIGQEIEN